MDSRALLDLVNHHYQRAEGFRLECERLARLLVPPPELATCAAQLPLFPPASRGSRIDASTTRRVATRPDPARQSLEPLAGLPDEVCDE